MVDPVTLYVFVFWYGVLSQVALLLVACAYTYEAFHYGEEPAAPRWYTFLCSVVLFSGVCFLHRADALGPIPLCLALAVAYVPATYFLARKYAAHIGLYIRQDGRVRSFAGHFGPNEAAAAVLLSLTASFSGSHPTHIWVSLTLVPMILAPAIAKVWYLRVSLEHSYDELYVNSKGQLDSLRGRSASTGKDADLFDRLASICWRGTLLMSFLGPPIVLLVALPERHPNHWVLMCFVVLANVLPARVFSVLAKRERARLLTAIKSLQRTEDMSSCNVIGVALQSRSAGTFLRKHLRNELRDQPDLFSQLVGLIEKGWGSDALLDELWFATCYREHGRDGVYNVLQKQRLRQLLHVSLQEKTPLNDKVELIARMAKSKQCSSCDDYKERLREILQCKTICRRLKKKHNIELVADTSSPHDGRVC